MGIMQDFKEFLNEYKVMGLAVAFIMGVAATALIQALVNDIIMPIIGRLIPGGAWQTATLDIAGMLFKWGDFLSQVINFVIIAFVVFLIAKFIMGEKKVTKK
ncbi:putative large-conductance mechanosensitive channel [Methanocella paludicola SANAE]|uniref:Large-conductance mechanosensitive channel n=2 Tax=Methanocella TaxID=570266 RepID=D1YYF3_METPS|nr:putative large-conductance mechanosensitive channel [Methanocella paludicola SANAE]